MKPTHIWMRPLLGIFAMVGLLALTGYITYQVFDVGFEKVAKEALIVWVALVQTVILAATNSNGFYFGTSQGSANKAETIDKIVNDNK